MKTWPTVLWVVFFGMIALIVGIVSVLAKKYYEYYLVATYIGWVGAVGLWFYWKKIGATDVHIHHYCVTAFLVSVIGYQSAFLTFVQAVCSGIMVEGGSRWGYDPIFTYDGQSQSKQLKKAKRAQAERIAKEMGSDSAVVCEALTEASED